MFKLIDNKPRSVLCEGRSKGMGHALCKRDGDTLTTVQPISPCKDYLNDVVYSEVTGKPFGAYGLHCVKEGIFEYPMAYMVSAICMQGARSPSKYDGYDEDVKAFMDNYFVIQKYLNLIEIDLKLKEFTELQKIGDNLILSIFPKFWVDGTYKISLYTLLMRAALRWKPDTDPLNVKNLSQEDTYNLNSAIPKLKRMIKGEIPKQDFSASSGWHDLGIVGYEFP